jgi:hypothetical protein
MMCSGIGKRLDLKEPPHIPGGKLFVRVTVHRKGRRNIHKVHLHHALRMIEAKTMCRAGAAVVTRHEKPLIAEGPHRLHLILSHRAKRVVDVTLAAVGFARIAVASQVRNDHGVIACKARSDLMPRYVRLRMTVNQQ